jgi:lipopolysaccharide export system permease protein
MSQKPQREIFQHLALAGPFCSVNIVASHSGVVIGGPNPPMLGTGDVGAMSSIDRYIFRTTFGAFALIAVSLTLLIWITQALREIDLMTNQGQAILVFIGMTGLLIPVLVLIIAPIALMIAVTYTLNRLNADSEMIVLSAAGMSPWRLFVPFGLVALLVSLMVGVIGFYVGPKGLRELRAWAAQLRADLISTAIKPGRFTTIERGLTFHIRERRTNGQLVGLLIDDLRNPKERITILAERGEVLENDRGTYLVLSTGSVQRREEAKRDPAIVLFDRYAFDLSNFQGGGDNRMITARERYLWELANPDPSDLFFRLQPGAYRAEFHDRVVAPFYPLAFAVLAYAFLGIPATTRQSRTFALGLTIVSVGALRFAGFGSTIFAAQNPKAVVLLYASLVAAFVVGFLVLWRGVTIEPPRMMNNAIQSVMARFARLGAPA